MCCWQSNVDFSYFVGKENNSQNTIVFMQRGESLEIHA
jgi:hypothetical protein